jgi:hypothetical protein
MKTELASFESMSIEALEVAAQSAFEECEHVFQAIEKNRNRLEIFGRILTAAKAKVPHGQWEDWITDTFQGRLALRTAQRWMAGPKAPKVALLGESKNETVSRAARIPDRVEVVESASEPGDHSGDANKMVDEQPSDDLTPDPPTIRKTAKGSEKVSEEKKPRTQPIVPEVLADDEMEIAKVDPVAEWIDNHSLSEIVGRIVEKIEDDKARKLAAKQLRKLADQLDPPTKFTRPDLEEVSAYFAELKASGPDSFFDFYESKGWLVGKVSMKDWRASARKWVRENRENPFGGKSNGNGHSNRNRELTAEDVFSAEALGRGGEHS